MFWNNLFEALCRKKYNNDDEDEVVEFTEQIIGTNSNLENEETAIDSNNGEKQVKLARVLGLVDLIMLGVGSTLGVGVYVLAGSVARNQAGPSIILSFMIAAVASLFSGLCYSEFASKISKSGSAYNYTYTSIGEFVAYIIGWNLILEYMIGTASEAKAISNQIDSLFGNICENTMIQIFPIKSSFLSNYPDFLAPIFVIIIGTLLSYGVKESTKINNIFTIVNLITVGSIVFTGLFKINLKNWNIKKEDIPSNINNAGNGGFIPFGINGIIVGAAKCFFGFVGFEGITTSGEETKNPKKNVPLSIILSLIIVFICYFSIAVVLTLVLPYYEQNPDAPFPHVFDKLGWPFMKWLVTTGSMFALFTAMFGAFFPLPRILYSMSKDGLLYKKFSSVSSVTKTPIISTSISAFITAIMSSIFKLDQLVDMMSIGTLLAYIVVATCLLILRYTSNEIENNFHKFNVHTLGNKYKDTGINITTNNTDGLEENEIIHNRNHLENMKETNQDDMNEQIDRKLKNERMDTKPTIENFNSTDIITNDTDVFEVNEIIQNKKHLENSKKKIQDDVSERIDQKLKNERIDVKTVIENFNNANVLINDSDMLEVDEIIQNRDNLENRKETDQKEENKYIKRKRNTSLINIKTTNGNHNSNNNISILKNKQKIKNDEEYEQESTKIYLKTHATKLKESVDETENTKENDFTNNNMILNLLNIKNNKSITLKSQTVSKVCIYNIIILTIIICLALNNVISKENGVSYSNQNINQITKYNVTNNENLQNNQREISQISLNINSKNISSIDMHIKRSRNKSVEIEENIKNVPNHDETQNKLNTDDEIIKTHELITLTEYIMNKLNITYLNQNINESIKNTIKYISYVVLGVLYVLNYIVLSRQAQTTISSSSEYKFQVPFVPLIPCVSIFMNVYLMINLDISTWIRFVVWLILGMFIYFTYSIFHSKQKNYSK